MDALLSTASVFLSTLSFVGIAIIMLILVLLSLFTVEQQTRAIIERFGKFHSVRNPGLQIKIPYIDTIVKRISLRIRQLDVIVETKTEDNVFVDFQVSVQFQVLDTAVYDAYYKLDDPETQIKAYIFDVVRAEIPKMKLDDVFGKKDDVAIAIRKELQDAMKEYGYNIIKALVTDIKPAEEVKLAMNRINAAEREKLAAEYEGAAERIKIVARATAEAESKKLQGEGIANQRREIAKGLEESMQVLHRAGIAPAEASALIIITQHYDTLHAIGTRNNSSLILLPNSPDAAGQMLTNTLTALSANAKFSEISTAQPYPSTGK